MAKRYDTVLFDLDGTLTDSAEGIFKSVRHALEIMGKPIPPDETLKKFLGPPLTYSFSQLCGLDEDNTATAIRLYRERYSTVGLFENKPYDGVRQMLDRLKDGGITLAVATSKPQAFAKRILERFELDGYFRFIGGSGLDGTLDTKAEVIAYTLENLGVADKSCVLMAGDRFHDIEGAKKLGIASLAVLYGYGGREEFESYKADYIVSTPWELADFILA